VRVPRIVVTSGEPAGIGPDACVALSRSDWPADLVIAGDAQLLEETAAAVSAAAQGTTAPGGPPRLCIYDPSVPPEGSRAGVLKLLDVPAPHAVVAGRLDPRNAASVIAMLDRACDGCMSGEFAAMVTAPVQKSTLMEAGFDFLGHTEYLAARSGAALPVMMLQNAALRVALVTTHLPLALVPHAITAARLRATLEIVHEDLRRRFGVPAPRIAVLGLNPHAGESGHLGREEIDVIEPVIRQLRAQGLDLRGPVPADTAFTPQFLAGGVDVVVAMYHDQGLPVIKHDGFGQTVNVTLGLPIIRTSVDHGTALSLARTGRADTGSLEAAVSLAIELASHGDS
jgi:4-hydroxythreonine-4-phosphate dehydrogenase